jgi:hypothetical protein
LSRSCSYVAAVTGTPYFGVTTGDGVCGPNQRCIITLEAAAKLQGDGWGRAAAWAADGRLGGVLMDGGAVAAAGAAPVDPGAANGDVADQELPSFGFPRDRFWPQSVAAFVVVGIVLTLLSAQLVAPTRRLRLLRLRRRPPAATPPHEVPS